MRIVRATKLLGCQPTARFPGGMRRTCGWHAEEPARGGLETVSASRAYSTTLELTTDCTVRTCAAA